MSTHSQPDEHHLEAHLPGLAAVLGIIGIYLLAVGTHTLTAGVLLAAGAITALSLPRHPQRQARPRIASSTLLVEAPVWACALTAALLTAATGQLAVGWLIALPMVSAAAQLASGWQVLLADSRTALLAVIRQGAILAASSGLALLAMMNAL